MAVRRCLACSKFMPAIKGRGRPALRCSKCNPVKVAAERTCRECEVVLPAPEGRGRPAVRCFDCRTKLINA